MKIIHEHFRAIDWAAFRRWLFAFDPGHAADFLTDLIVGLVFDTCIFGLGLSIGVAIAVMKPWVDWPLWAGLLLGVCWISLIFSALRYWSKEREPGND